MEASKKDLLDKFVHAYDSIFSILKSSGGKQEELLHFVPKLPDAWSINDHLVHLFDADNNLSARLRFAFAESGKAIPYWEELLWHEHLNYQTMPGRDCLEHAHNLRRLMGIFLTAKSAANWNEFSIKLGPPEKYVTVLDLINKYISHAEEHLNYVQRNYDLWKKEAHQ